MKTFSTVTSLLALFSSALAAPVDSAEAAGTTVSVSYDTAYDVSGASLTTVSCSDGANGLINKGYSNFGSLPGFPKIGGAPTIAGWDSPNCGKCYALTYNGQTVNILAIDSAPGGFNIALEAMNTLTNNQAQQLGRIEATYTEVDVSLCA
ncbi:hypothetical protein CBS147353_1445 [Aspergillus niger]|nr:hypothetical protein CBS147353_1445 [Aspergillus niger]